MKCSQCATDLPDTAAICSTCGQSTHPSQAAVFSYLPTGTPPWPGSVPQQIPYIVDAEAHVHAALPTNTDVITPVRRSPASILAILAVLVLTPLLGILLTLAILHQNGQMQRSGPAPVRNTNSSGTQTVTHDNQQPGATSLKTAKDSNLNMTLQYPSDWTAGALVQSGDPIYLPLQAQQKQIAVFVQRYSDSSSASIPSSSALNNGSVQGLSQIQGVHNLQSITPANKQPTIGGTKWDQQDAIFSNANNVQIHFTTISVQHNRDYYSIVSIEPQLTYQEVQQKEMQPLLNSAQFLS